MYYTVKEIAELLSVNEETVRRWIRDGKLQAERGAGRQGNKISEEELRKFIEINRGTLTSGIKNTLGIVSSIGGIGGAIGMGVSIVSSMPISVATISSAALVSILRSKDKNRKQMIEELYYKRTELELASMQIKLEIARQQNELKTIEEQIKILNEIIDN